MGKVHDKPAFLVDQIDHVELFVPDRRQAADWYRRVLGLTICSGYEHWAEEPKGPLRSVAWGKVRSSCPSTAGGSIARAHSITAREIGRRFTDRIRWKMNMYRE